MFASDAGRAASRALHRAGWLLHAHVVETKLCALRDAVEDKYDPNQPRVPAGNPDGGQWTDGGGVGGSSGPSERVRLAQNDPPDHRSDVRPRPRNLPRAIRSVSDIPKTKPKSTQKQNAIIKFVAQEVAELVVVRAAVGRLVRAEARQAVRRAVGRVLIGLKVATWVAEEGLPSIVSYSDPPRTLEELQDAAEAGRLPGYEIHHIVEQNSKQPGEDARINSRENLVRIPTFKHHQITGFIRAKPMRTGGDLQGRYSETRIGIRVIARASNRWWTMEF